ncbi:hypothetical protein [Campylobacter gastrosuis]|uniref:Helix-turn-helix domain-containing protein n=1 Tax=Campylobacter gastrosuis TaxID=2974576 RepID=A0ABT7HNL2_9BACT|nr:hypothetical protein [Campylobacter gastrosuis]MDL0088499.1 helix-turn-helix domain-containing protein [Campylobacter gastrosuis]
MQTKIAFESIGDRLDAMRKVANMTKQEAFKFLGTTKFIYAEVRFGRKQMPLDWAYKFHERYGFRLDWIYSGKGEIFDTK